MRRSGPLSPWRTPTFPSSASARLPAPVARPISPTSTASSKTSVQPLSESPPASGCHTSSSAARFRRAPSKTSPHLFRLRSERQDLDVAVAMCPEFLREGTGIADFFSPPLHGHRSLGHAGHRHRCRDCSPSSMRRCGSCTPGPPKPSSTRATHSTPRRSPSPTSSGGSSSRLGVDSREVMELFCEDTRSTSHPGTCGPASPSADPACLRTFAPFCTWRGRTASTSRCSPERLPATGFPIVDAIDRVVGSEGRRVTLLGLSFKPGSDDLRESPYVDLAETLLGKGYEVRIYDPILNPSSLVGANRQYVESRLPHLRADPYRRTRGAIGEPTLRSSPSRRRTYGGPPGVAPGGSSTSTVGSVPTSRRWRATRGSPGETGPETTQTTTDQTRHGGSHRYGALAKARRVLILVQNLSVPFDRRVWLECQCLAAGFRVAVVCPKGARRPGTTSCRRRGPLQVPARTHQARRASRSSASTLLVPRYSAAQPQGNFGDHSSPSRVAIHPDLFWPIGLLFRVFMGRRSFSIITICARSSTNRVFPDG